MFKFEEDYFQKYEPNIIGNDNLREPQIGAYEAVYEHFIHNSDHAKVILPTGTGKTGLMSILPYGISNSRVLIITPQLVIKDAVLGSLDPNYDNNFWIMTNIFEKRDHLPSVIEYETEHDYELLKYANIVILNIHKLQKRLKSSLIKKVPHDFFDMIIIDEAHHAEAQTWKDAIEYFCEAKVVKVTGTPFRSDGKSITGKDVYEYKLRQAMSMGYVKTLERIEHIPDKLYLTVDKNEDVQYSIDEIRAMGLKDEDWINRSVALSPKSNESIVSKSIELLEQKLSLSKFPHKIIAVACSIWHANQLKTIYEHHGYDVAIVHSDLDKQERQSELDKIENNKVSVIINVAMLGEGYDHKYLSVAAIFRPYKTLLPYSQFIGRVLRSIPSEEGLDTVPEDNIAAVVYHKELGLDELWKYYKEEIIKKDMIPRFTEDIEINPRDTNRNNNKSFGETHEEGSLVDVDYFIESELIELRKKRQLEEDEKVKEMMNLLNVSEDKARQLYKQASNSDDKQRLLRPDLFVQRSRKRIDETIKNKIVPDLLFEYNLKLEGHEISQIKFLFSGRYKWIRKKTSENGAILAIYLQNRLNYEIGGKRDEWSLEDWPKAEKLLDDIVEYLKNSLDQYIKR